jgi:hypothetical protein
MSSDAATTSPPRPSVFISYASEDRAAARTLRDTLAATGLDVWYDENELGGGDAWDQKIRRQIRDCDYFLPMISAATEARKEGYFRREWRLAAERTLDMADDVLFLLPVVIDGTSESGARVPDKFLTVQWLRLPGGQSTPALEALCLRLLAGEHSAPPRPTSAFTRPPLRTPLTHTPLPPPLASTPPPLDPPAAARPGDADHGPPPMPPFPHRPEKGSGHEIKFVAEILWWVITAAWLLIKRAPKWIRLLLSIWFAFFVFSRCDRSPSADPKPPREKKTVRADPVDEAFKSAVEQAKANPDLTGAELAKLGTSFARHLAEGLKETKKPPRLLIVVPFAHGLTDPAAAKFAETLFASTFGHLALARSSAIGLSPAPPAAFGDDALLEHARKISAPHLLAARMKTVAPFDLELILVRSADGTHLWTASYPLDPVTTPSVAKQISSEVLNILPKK